MQEKEGTIQMVDKLEKWDYKNPVRFNKFKGLPSGQGNSRITELGRGFSELPVQLLIQHYSNYP